LHVLEAHIYKGKISIGQVFYEKNMNIFENY